MELNEELVELLANWLYNYKSSELRYAPGVYGYPKAEEGVKQIYRKKARELIAFLEGVKRNGRI